MEALILDVPNKTAVVRSIPIPKPAPNELLIQVHALALNPVDALYTLNPLAPESQTRVVGTDFAGTITQLGSSVPSSSSLAPGTRVAGFLQGACSVNFRPGAAAEYVIVDWDLVWKIPEGMDFESASSVSLCALTAAQGLFYRLGIRAPFSWDSNSSSSSDRNEDKKELRVFIYGSSTSLGLYAAQLVNLAAKASGLEPILFGAASAGKHEFLKAAPYNYHSLVDYRDENWVQKFLEAEEKVDYAVDCICEGDSVRNVIKTVKEGGNMAIYRSRAAKAWRADEGELPFEPIYGGVWEGLGVEIEYYGFSIPASPKARSFAVEFYKFLSTINAGEIRFQPNTVRLMPGGLKNIVNDGFALLGPGKMEDRKVKRTEEWMKPVSAEKLVYKLDKYVGDLVGIV